MLLLLINIYQLIYKIFLAKLNVLLYINDYIYTIINNIRIKMSLESFFNPKSVAVVGVSSDPSKLGAVVFNNLINAKFEGNLYAINPKCAGQELFGKQCLSLA